MLTSACIYIYTYLQDLRLPRIYEELKKKRDRNCWKPGTKKSGVRKSYRANLKHDDNWTHTVRRPGTHLYTYTDTQICVFICVLVLAIDNYYQLFVKIYWSSIDLILKIDMNKGVLSLYHFIALNFLFSRKKI